MPMRDCSYRGDRVTGSSEEVKNREILALRAPVAW